MRGPRAAVLHAAETERLTAVSFCFLMRLLSWNVHEGINSRDRQYLLVRIIDCIEAKNPDVICLQEVAYPSASRRFCRLSSWGISCGRRRENLTSSACLSWQASLHHVYRLPEDAAQWQLLSLGSIGIATRSVSYRS